jgi:hypothetical protein
LMESDKIIEDLMYGIAEHYELDVTPVEKLEETDRSSSVLHNNTARACSSTFI